MEKEKGAGEVKQPSYSIVPFFLHRISQNNEVFFPLIML